MDSCVHSMVCGGCIYQGIPYQEQLELKAKTLLHHLKENQIPYHNFLGIEGSPSQYFYRNKMEYTFGDEMIGGEMTLGLHKQGRFMSIITVDQCQLVDPDFNRILTSTLEFCREKGYAFYHKKTHKGLLRHLIIRKGQNTGELLINIVTSTQEPFDGEAFVERINHLPLTNQVVGILHTRNDGLADAVQSDEIKLLQGQDYYQETLMGLSFKISPFSFFQTNVRAIEKLYTEAISAIDHPEDKTVYDLYSGTGTITQALAQRVKKAIGIELVEEAVAVAKENAMGNGLTNCDFLVGDVLQVLDEVEEKPDVIVLDPPRSGVHPKALQKILNYRVKQIIYISCNPKTLSENLATAVLNGYDVTNVKAYDNFPLTRHTEVLAILRLAE